jgi:hypothetical protein
MKHTILVAFLFLTSSLTACATSADGQTDQQQYQQEKAQCNREPLTPENAEQRQNCVNQSLIYHAQRDGVPLSIIYQRTSSDTQAAVAYSEGKVNAAEYQAELAQDEANFIRTGEAALSAQQQQQSQNWSNAMSGVANAFQRQKPVDNAPAPSAPKNMFCVPINGGVSCTPAP